MSHYVTARITDYGHRQMDADCQLDSTRFDDSNGETLCCGYLVRLWHPSKLLLACVSLGQVNSASCCSNANKLDENLFTIPRGFLPTQLSGKVNTHFINVNETRPGLA